MMYIAKVIQGYITENDTLLDVSCGRCNASKDIKAKIKIGIDVYRIALQEAKKHCIPINMDMRDVGKMFLPKTFDIVLWMDGIEHLSTNESMVVLEALEGIAKKRIIVFTPNEFFDNLGMVGKEEDEHQLHRSLFKDDFWRSRGYKIQYFQSKTTSIKSVLAVKDL